MCSLGNALLRNLSKAYVATTAKIPGTKEANVSKSPKVPKNNETLKYYYDEKRWKKDNLTDGQERSLNVSLGWRIGDLKEDSNRVNLIQEELKIDLPHFLKTGEEVHPQSVPLDSLRMAPYDFGFSLRLAHDEDLKLFLQELDKVRQWHKDAKIRDTYLSPTLTIVQSSGTGKSRLMIEAQKQLETNKLACRTILLSSKDHANLEKDTFDTSYCIPDTLPGEDGLNKARDMFRNMIFHQCAEAISKSNPNGEPNENDPTEVILFFDEAQHLAKHGGYLLRVLRWILRENPEISNDKKKYRIVAVLAGTTTSLTNFFPEVEAQSSDTRVLNTKGAYFEKGETPFDPFFMFRTMGCLANHPDVRTPQSMSESEYDNMIRYGRPLFAAMHKEKRLGNNEIFEIANKIILGDMTMPLASCLSVLGTRIQMGQTSVAMVSRLVSKGYAHLTSFQQAPKRSDVPSKATFTFLPDPVCARICMALMDKDFAIQGGRNGRPRTLDATITGNKKTFWSAKMGELFSNSICEANKGDYGEVASALFLLFCGDILRKKADPDYKTFSVALGQYLEQIARNANATEDDDPTNVESGHAISNCHVNFIQLFQYRFHIALSDLGRSDFLEGLYNKACAVYSPNNREAVDLVVPCRSMASSGRVEYIPIFVSVKNQAEVYPATANGFLSESLKKLHSAGITKGLLLLCLVGQDREDLRRSDYNNVLGKKRTDSLSSLKLDDELKKAVCSNVDNLREKLVPKMFCIHKDEFGIYEAVMASKSQKAFQRADVFTMHHELLHEEQKESDKNTQLPSFVSSFRKEPRDLYKKTLGCVSKYSTRLTDVKESKLEKSLEDEAKD